MSKKLNKEVVMKDKPREILGYLASIVLSIVTTVITVIIFSEF